MSDAWLATRDPNASSIPHWPAYPAEKRTTMLFDVVSRVVDDPNAKITGFHIIAITTDVAVPHHGASQRNPCRIERAVPESRRPIKTLRLLTPCRTQIQAKQNSGNEGRHNSRFHVVYLFGLRRKSPAEAGMLDAAKIETVMEQCLCISLVADLREIPQDLASNPATRA